MRDGGPCSKRRASACRPAFARKAGGEACPEGAVALTSDRRPRTPRSSPRAAWPAGDRMRCEGLAVARGQLGDEFVGPSEPPGRAGLSEQERELGRPELPFTASSFKTSRRREGREIVLVRIAPSLAIAARTLTMVASRGGRVRARRAGSTATVGFVSRSRPRSRRPRPGTRGGSGRGHHASTASAAVSPSSPAARLPARGALEPAEERVEASRR